MTTCESIADLARTVVNELIESGMAVATAESCTGGWIAKSLTDVAGSSAAFGYGIVSYSNGAKEQMLGVSNAKLTEHGAVSEEVVSEMAEGALNLSGANIAVGVSGVAGPEGGTDEKPVGTVFIGLARQCGGRGGRVDVTARRFFFPGDRTMVRDRSAKSALQMLRFALLDVPPAVPLLWEPRTP